MEICMCIGVVLISTAFCKGVAEPGATRKLLNFRQALGLVCVCVLDLPTKSPNNAEWEVAAEQNWILQSINIMKPIYC